MMRAGRNGGGGGRPAAGLHGRVIPTTGYGLTETTSAVMLNAAEDFLARPSGIGWPLPTVQIRVCDETGQEVPSGTPGELWVRGPQVASGYFGASSVENSAFSNGWFRTGDLVTRGEDGFVELVGRLKDIIIRGGENIQCAEVEAVLDEHPDVLESAVFGVPDPLYGEEVSAVVRPRPGCEVHPQTIIEFARDNLAGFKVPKNLTISIAPLPRNAAGKLVKSRLRNDDTSRNASQNAAVCERKEK